MMLIGNQMVYSWIISLAFCPNTNHLIIIGYELNAHEKFPNFTPWITHTYIFQKVENGHLWILLSFQCYEIFLHLTFGFMRMKDTILRILKISPLTNGHGNLLCICLQKHLRRNKSIVYSGHLLDNFAF